MTEEQMERLLKSDADRTKGFTQEEMDEMQQELDRQNLEEKQRQDEEMKEEFSPGLEEDRTAPLEEEPERKVEPSQIASADTTIKEFMETLFTESPDAERLDDDDDEPAPVEAEKVVTAKAGGSIEKEADFVKDDDEEPADPPPGATPEEVADDIPAYLSTGEYVLPANVVRYIGLQQIVAMHKGALSELQQMEDLDIIENVDENGMVEEDDDEMDYLKEPKGVVKTTLVVAKPHPSGMMAMPFQEGGTPDPDFDMDPGGTPTDPGQDDTLGEEDEDTPTNTGSPGAEPAPGSDTYREAEKQLEQVMEDRGFKERVGDFLYDLAYNIPTPTPSLDITPAYRNKQIQQAMRDAKANNLNLTREQIEEQIDRLNLGLQMSPEDVAKANPATGKLGALGQAAMRGLVEKDVTLSPNFDMEIQDQLEPDRGGGEDIEPIKPLELADEKDTDEGPFPGFKLFPGIGYRKVNEDVKTVKRGGLMGY